ncbi:OmpA family protein [Cytophagaceae bacterium ABcell3]|nr:OmpA family protein [Cytophagaceae bacterium ABcell3]
MKARAAHANRTGDIYTALFYYKEITQHNPSDLDAWYKMAELHKKARNYGKAEESFLHVYEKAPGQYPYTLFHIAQMQKMQGKYEEAKKNILTFRKEGGSRLGDKNFKRLVTQELQGCDSGMVFKEFPEHVEVLNAGKSVNYPHTEFSPILIDSATLAFGSLRMDSLTYFSTRDKSNIPLRQIYKAEKKNNKWKEKGKFDIVNDPDMEMGNFTYSPITNKIYFSKCDKDDKEIVTCKIYMTEKVKGKWSEPELLPEPINQDGYTSTQPAIVTDTTGKEFLYFVSDIPKGKGGLDIWYATYNSRRKTWNNPTNAGFRINTPEDECTPFFHVPTQTLYFSSNGHSTAGGFDIYKTWRAEDGRFVPSQNLSFPINSPQDDLDFMLSDDGKTGFFVSNRPGGTPYFHETCCDDIFMFEILPPPPFECELELAIETPEDSMTCDSLVMHVYSMDKKTKAEITDTIYLDDCNYKLPLERNKKYTFSINPEGFEPDTLSFDTREMASAKTISKRLVKKPFEPEIEEPILDAKPVEDKPFTLDDVQYATDDFRLNDDAKAALDSILLPFLNLHPNSKVEITSHTDDVGTEKYNMRLSQKRADYVVRHLVSKGIEKDRLIAKGMGQSQPLVPNLNPDGTPNERNRSINRRTEFLLIKP